MTGLERIRRRAPVIVFVLLLVLVLLMVGFACACFSDQPLKAVERTLGGLSTHPALIELWAALVIVLTTAPVLVVRRLPRWVGHHPTSCSASSFETDVTPPRAHARYLAIRS